MTDKEQLAGICGLFCGTCPMYPEACHGCLSDQLAPDCRDCRRGFRTCAKEHGVTWCFECADFPCAHLEKFLDAHWENGISHHAGVIDSLKRMRVIGVAAWVDEEQQKAECPKCGCTRPWNEITCPCRR